MKYVLLVLSIILFIPVLNFAAIPITDNAPIKEKIENEKQSVKEEVVKNKTIKKASFLKRHIANKIANKLGLKPAEDGPVPIFNVLSFTFGLLSFVALIAAAFAASIPLVLLASLFGLAGIVLGVVGLVRQEKLRGLTIAGMVLGGIGGLIALLVLLIDSEL